MYDPEKSKWASKIEEYGSDKPIGMRVLIYGPYGKGKTTFAGTFPKPLFIDMELGENVRLREAKHPYLYLPPGIVYSNLVGILRDWINKRDVFDPEGGPHADRQTIVIDSWTKLNQFLLMEIAAQEGRKVDETNATPRDYLLLSSRQNEIIILLKELAYRHGIHVVITALPKVEGDEVESLKRDDNSSKAYSSVVGMPHLLGSFRRLIGADTQEVYYIDTIEGATTVYRLWTSPHQGYHAKTRLGLPSTIDDPSYDKIVGLVGKKR